MNATDLASIIQIVLWLIFIVASLAQLPVVRSLITSQIGEKNASQLQVIAQTAVHMTEQQLGSLPGNEKKIAAVNAFKNLAQAQGLEVSEAELHAFIEAAVLFLPKSIKLLPVPEGAVPATAPAAQVPVPADNQVAPAVPAA